MEKVAKASAVTFLIFGGLFLIFFPFRQLTDGSDSQVAGQSFSSLPLAGQTPPVIRAGAPEFLTEAVSAYAVDARTGRVLYDKNGDLHWPTASLAKLMTAQVVVNLASFEAVVEVNEEDLAVAPPVMGLEAGEMITVMNLLRGMLIMSANDAANVLARALAGNQQRFAELMDLMARQLGLFASSFKNSIGFDESGQYTCAKDLANLTLAFLKNPDLAEMVATKTLEVKSVDGAKRHWLKSSNKLLSDKDIHGVKTGYTEAALGNLILLASDDAGNQIVSVVLGSQQREAESRALVDWVFRAYDF